jgi:hypothetical protein
LLFTNRTQRSLAFDSSIDCCLAIILKKCGLWKFITSDPYKRDVDGSAVGNRVATEAAATANAVESVPLTRTTPVVARAGPGQPTLRTAKRSPDGETTSANSGSNGDDPTDIEIDHDANM